MLLHTYLENRLTNYPGILNLRQIGFNTGRQRLTPTSCVSQKHRTKVDEFLNVKRSFADLESRKYELFICSGVLVIFITSNVCNSHTHTQLHLQTQQLYLPDYGCEVL